MSRVEKWVCAVVDFLFVVMVGILLLLLLLRAISKVSGKKLVVDSSEESAMNTIDTMPMFLVNEGLVAQPIEETIVDATEVVPEDLSYSHAGREAERPQEIESLTEKAEAYCVKCREKREVQNAHRVVTKNGRNALEGLCPVCGTKLFRFIAR